jgi:hypothetical protein
MVANALLLSAVYLGVGLGVEILLRFIRAPWLQKLSLALDSLPARTLALLGLLQPLAEAAGRGHLSGFWLRAIFGVTTIAIVFVLALVSGLLMAGTWWLTRRGRS